MLLECDNMTECNQHSITSDYGRHHLFPRCNPGLAAQLQVIHCSQISSGELADTAIAVRWRARLRKKSLRFCVVRTCAFADHFNTSLNFCFLAYLHNERGCKNFSACTQSARPPHLNRTRTRSPMYRHRKKRLRMGMTRRRRRRNQAMIVTGRY